MSFPTVRLHPSQRAMADSEPPRLPVVLGSGRWCWGTLKARDLEIPRRTGADEIRRRVS